MAKKTVSDEQDNKRKDNYEHYVKPVQIIENFEDIYKLEHHLIRSYEELIDFYHNKFKPNGIFAFDTETSSLNAEQGAKTGDLVEGKIVGYSFTQDGHIGYYVPLSHPDYSLGYKALKIFYAMICRSKLNLLYNCRFDMRFLEAMTPEKYDYTPEQDEKIYKFDLSGIKYIDVQNTVWLADTNVAMPSLKKSEKHFLGWNPPTFSETIGDESNFGYLPAEQGYRYASLDALATYHLFFKTEKYYTEAGAAAKLDNDLLYPLMRLENTPINVDHDYLQSMRGDVLKHLEDLKKYLFETAGREYNINSGRELVTIFQQLGIDTGKRTKTGIMETNIKAIEGYVASHGDSEYLNKLVEYKKLLKFDNSYLEKMLEMSEAENVAKHPIRFCYFTNKVPTGRLASGTDGKNSYFSKLNFQSLPKPHSHNYHVHKATPEQIANGEDLCGYIFNDDPNGSLGLTEGQDPHLNVRKAFCPIDNDSVVVSVDMCLESGSPVQTKRGYMGIGELKVGDEILTPDGYVKVLRVKNTGIKKLYKVNTDGQSIYCSEDHPFMINNEQVPAHNINHTLVQETFIPYKSLNPFELSTPTSAYLLGYILGDNSMTIDDYNHYKLFISSTDYNHVKQIANIFGGNLETVTHTFDNMPYLSINIVDQAVCHSLLELGVKPRKSTEPSNIDYDWIGRNFNHFIRGLIDSDGCICRKKNSLYIEIAGHESYIKQISDMMPASWGIYKNDNIFVIAKRGNSKDKLDFYSYLYKDATIWLQRKRDKYDEWIIDTFKELPSFEMYDITIDSEDHVYLCNGVRTHNCAEELRLVANIYKEQTWIKAFNSGQDVHKSCYSDDTEFLTIDGWKTYDKITENTLIAQYDNGNISYVKAGPVYYGDTGELYRFKTKYNDLLVTGNHRMLYRNSNRGKEQIKLAEDLHYGQFKNAANYDCQDIVDDFVFADCYGTGFNKNKKYADGFKLKPDTMIKFLGFYLGDGHAGIHGGRYKISLSQSCCEAKRDTLQWVKDLNIEMCSFFNEYWHDAPKCKPTSIVQNGSPYYTFERCHKTFCQWILDNCIINGIKRIPKFIYNASLRQRRLFIESFFRADGTYDKRDGRKGFTLYIYHKELLDDFQRLCIMSNYSTYIDQKHKPHSGIYRLSVHPLVWHNFDQENITKEYYSGKTVCYSVPSGVLIVRRNDKVSVCGNTACKIFGEENYCKEARKKAKCISGDSLLYTDMGIIKIRDINPNRIEGLPIDVDFNISTPEGVCRCSKFIYNGNKNTIKFNMNNGATLEVTPDHLVRSDNKWVRADSLNTGDYIDFESTDIDSNNYQTIDLSYINGAKLTFSKELSYYIGAILGDGSISRKNVYFMSEDYELIQYMSSIVKRYNLGEAHENVQKYTKTSNKPFIRLNCGPKKARDLCRDIGLIDDAGHKQFKVPDVVLKSPNDVKFAFIQGIFDTDGTISKYIGHKSNFSLDFCTKSNELAVGCMHILRCLGVSCRICRSYNKVYKRMYYKVKLRATSARRFLELGGFKCIHKQDRLKEWCKNASFIKEYKKHYMIESIEESNSDVYDLTIENESHSFLANGFVVHNCASFGILYGASAYGFHNQFPDMTLEECEEFIEKFKAALPSIEAGQKASVRYAKKNGFVKTYFGRPRRVKYYLNHPDRSMRSFGERTVKNTAVQGAAGDCLKLMIIRLWKELFSKYPEVKWVGSIHDEITYIIPKSILIDALKIIKKCQTIKLPDWPVQLDCDISIGKSFGELIPWFLDDETGELTPQIEEIKHEQTEEKSENKVNEYDMLLDADEYDYLQ